MFILTLSFIYVVALSPQAKARIASHDSMDGSKNGGKVMKEFDIDDDDEDEDDDEDGTGGNISLKQDLFEAEEDEEEEDEEEEEDDDISRAAAATAFLDNEVEKREPNMIE